jgi:SAM-dependent methyltransferase
MVSVLNHPDGSLALDIGCGICANSVRLARRGYRVVAADYSESILERARWNVERNGLVDHIEVRREDILDLSFPTDRFDLTFCFGVLMHIPGVERALSELVRVTKPGGYVVLEEINAHSPEAVLLRTFWRTLKRKKIRASRTPAGVEHQCEFGGETLFWRHADLRWLVDQLECRSCKLIARQSSAFTEIYQYLPGPFKALAHGWNRFYLRRVDWPRVAYHNLMVFQKS